MSLHNFFSLENGQFYKQQQINTEKPAAATTRRTAANINWIHTDDGDDDGVVIVVVGFLSVRIRSTIEVRKKQIM